MFPTEEKSWIVRTRRVLSKMVTDSTSTGLPVRASTAVVMSRYGDISIISTLQSPYMPSLISTRSFPLPIGV